mgnify:CR=1 FL=1|jgi:RecJ-like exonuclease
MHKIDTLKGETIMEKEVICPRCNGLGRLNCYKHVEDGICFLCAGKGTITQYDYEQYITAQIKADKNRAKRNAKREAELKATAKKIDKQRKEWESKKNQPKSKTEPKEPKPYNDDASKAIDDFLNFLGWCEK